MMENVQYMMLEFSTYLLNVSYFDDTLKYEFVSNPSLCENFMIVGQNLMLTFQKVLSSAKE